MRNYIELAKEILNNGALKRNRTSIDTLSLFGPQLEFNMKRGFPIVTTKKVFFNLVKSELLWFISGERSINFLHKHNNHIWDGNVYADYWENNENKRFKEDAGRVYGVQHRRWGESIDQLQKVITDIKENPNSRRHIVTAWNPGELDEMALPPCHILFQLYVHGDNLSLKMYQRSADYFLGVPFNISSYALLLAMIAQVTNTRPHRLILTFGDVHIYVNHIEQMHKQIDRSTYELPTLKLNPDVTDIDNFTMEDIYLSNYQSHPPIKGKMAV